MICNSNICITFNKLHNKHYKIEFISSKRKPNSFMATLIHCSIIMIRINTCKNLH